LGTVQDPFRKLGKAEEWMRLASVVLMAWLTGAAVLMSQLLRIPDGVGVMCTVFVVMLMKRAFDAVVIWAMLVACGLHWKGGYGLPCQC
jgi:hypothetical protein